MAHSTEMGRNEASLDRQIQTFYQVNRFISSVHDVDELLNLVMQESESAVGAEASCIALYDPADGQLHIKFANGEAGQDVRRLTMEMGQGVLGNVAANGETLRIDDVAVDPRFDSSIDHTTGFLTKSLLATPIQWRGKLLGVLEVVNKRDEPGSAASCFPSLAASCFPSLAASCFNENDERLLEIVANQAAIAVENSRLVERLVQSEQLSAIGKMAASIVHDFKGPLSVIRGFAELLASPDISPEKRGRFSNMILEDVDRFLGMTQELLDYSRGTMNLDPQPVHLGGWLEKLTDYIGENMSALGIRFIPEFNFTGEVKMDEARVRRVVQNLVANAADAMPDGGELTIASNAAGGRWQLSVSDTGCGIPVDLRPRVFEPFVTRGKEHGTGLGLAIAKEIVEGHGGSLRFETRTAGQAEGRQPGTTFFIDLPVAGPAIPSAP